MKNLLFNLTLSGMICVSGHDAKKLLQGQLTCHMDEVTDSVAKLAALCNLKGRIISLFYVLLAEGAYYLLMPRAMVPITITTLKKYAVFYQVTLVDSSEQQYAFGYQSIVSPPSPPFIQHPYDARRYILITTTKPSIENTSSASLNDWLKLELDAGIPLVYPETSGVFLPHELNLDALHAISFNKGCYTGQEIIARMHYRGTLKKRMILIDVQSTTPPIPGTDIIHQEMNASVVTFYQAGYNHYRVLIVTEKATS